MPQKPALCVAFKSSETESAQTDAVLRWRGANKVCLSSFHPDSLVPGICSALRIGAMRNVSCGQIDIRCMGSCEEDSSATKAHSPKHAILTQYTQY